VLKKKLAAQRGEETGHWGRLHPEIPDLHPPNVRVVRSRKMILARHVAHMEGFGGEARRHGTFLKT
jgi:hypothetical protein